MIINPFAFGTAAAGVTWNSADMGSNIALSGGDLVATCVVSNTNAIVRATTSHSSGKYYLEAVKTTIIASGYPYFGLCNAALSYSNTFANASPGVYISSGNNSFCYCNGANVNHGVTWANGDVVNIAVDLTALKVWIGKNNTYFNSGNPAAGTGSLFTITSDTYFPTACCKAVGAVLTARFASASWGFSAPSGFGEW